MIFAAVAEAPEGVVHEAPTGATMFRKRRLLFNALTYIPGAEQIPVVKRILNRRVTGTGGSTSARYCYSVWLRHLVLAGESGQNTHPLAVAELGPGDSLGVGIAALLTGARRYFAFDVVAHANAERNIAVLDALVELFEARAAIPDNHEFPQVSPQLRQYDFPHSILSDARLSLTLAPERIEAIRQSLRCCTSPTSMVQYRTSWDTEDGVEAGSIDMIFSQAVLEHVDRLEEAYRAMHRWLAPQGFMSHEIDLKCHGWAPEWNGHWRYSDAMWKLIRGKDSWFINREPPATHLRLLESQGYRIVRCDREKKPTKLTPHRLAKRYRSMSQTDLETSELFVQAVKS